MLAQCRATITQHVPQVWHECQRQSWRAQCGTSVSGGYNQHPNCSPGDSKSGVHNRTGSNRRVSLCVQVHNGLLTHLVWPDERSTDIFVNFCDINVERDYQRASGSQVPEMRAGCPRIGSCRGRRLPLPAGTDVTPVGIKELLGLVKFQGAGTS